MAEGVLSGGKWLLLLFFTLRDVVTSIGEFLKKSSLSWNNIIVMMKKLLARVPVI